MMIFIGSILMIPYYVMSQNQMIKNSKEEIPAENSTLFTFNEAKKWVKHDFVIEHIDINYYNSNLLLVSFNIKGQDSLVSYRFDTSSKTFTKNTKEEPSFCRNKSIWFDDKSILHIRPITSNDNHNFLPKIIFLENDQKTEMIELPTSNSFSDNYIALDIEVHQPTKSVLLTQIEELGKSRFFYKDKNEWYWHNIEVPEDSTVKLIGDIFIVFLNSDWKNNGVNYTSESVLALSPNSPPSQDKIITVIDTNSPETPIDDVLCLKDFVIVSKLTLSGYIINYFEISNTKISSTPTYTESGEGALDIVSYTNDSNSFIYKTEAFNSPESFWLQSPGGPKENLLNTESKIDTSKIVVQHNHARSLDKTEIPFTIVKRDDTPVDAPILMYGYGGFGITIKPFFSDLTIKLIVEQGGVFVLTRVRGGGDKGSNWHKQGQKLNKHKSAEDFIAIANTLKKTGYKKSRIVTHGGSIGGLLVAMASAKAPSLFKASIYEYPILDLLRYHLLGIGFSITGEIGDPKQNQGYLNKNSP